MNEYAYYGCGNAIGSIFANCMTEIVVFFFEGASMGVLMFFHFKNFRQGGLLASQESGQQGYATIRLGEYHFLTDEEVDAASLADRSSYEIEDSKFADVEQASADCNKEKHLIFPRPVLN